MVYVRPKKPRWQLKAEYDEADREQTEAVRLAVEAERLRRLRFMYEAGNDGWKRQSIFDEIRNTPGPQVPDQK
jgi:hypothetical protein